MVANIFGNSPVGPLERQIDTAYQCAKRLRPLVKAAVDGDWDAALECREDIGRLEREANEQMIAIRKRLPRSLFLAVPREDLLALLMVQDRIANRANSAADIILSRQLTIPEEIGESFLEFVDRNIEAAKLARKSVRELDELITTGFRGAEARLVESMVDELDGIHTESERHQSELRAGLFGIEDRLQPVDVMFLYKVIELTGDIASMAERVGRRLEVLLAR